MSEMVERAAKAILAKVPEGYGMTTAEARTYARAAIKEMREPTHHMKSVEGVHWDYSCHVCGGLKEGWYAMIDAALSE